MTMMMMMMMMTVVVVVVVTGSECSGGEEIPLGVCGGHHGTMPGTPRCEGRVVGGEGGTVQLMATGAAVVVAVVVVAVGKELLLVVVVVDNVGGGGGEEEAIVLPIGDALYPTTTGRLKVIIIITQAFRALCA